MTKLSQHGTFLPIFHVYLDLGLSYHQAALISYIDKWNQGGNECFASVEEIAKELRLTYITMRRVIDRCLSQNIITGSTGNKGRARTLKISNSFSKKVHSKLKSEVLKMSSQSAQSEQSMCSNRADQVLKVSTSSAQNEQLPRYNLDIIPRSNTNIKIPTSKTKIQEPKKLSDKPVKFMNVWDSAKSLMVRRRVE